MHLPASVFHLAGGTKLILTLDFSSTHANVIYEFSFKRDAFPYLAWLLNPMFQTEFNQIDASDEIGLNQRNPQDGRKEGM